jgi:D-3-phosphoglycerate dehydrogenase
MVAKPLVVVTDSVFPSLEPTERVLGTIGATLRLAPSATEEAIAAAAEQADALLVTYAPVTGALIERLTRCRVIARFGIGVDNVDVAAATRAGIVVTRVPDYCIDEVSDHALALLLALARKIPEADRHVKRGQWAVAPLAPIRRVRGKVLGLVGFGQIPRALAPKARALGLTVLAYDPYVPRDDMARAGVDQVSFEELVARSDFVSIHAPLLPETRHLFNADVFRRMKTTAYLINTARGPLIDELALVDALERGELAGAALDVLAQEPPPADSPLLRSDKVILTPHAAFYSEESLEELQRKAAEEVVRVLTGAPPRHPVNPEVLTSSRPSS